MFKFQEFCNKIIKANNCIFSKFGYNINMLNVIVAPNQHSARAEKHTKKIVKYLKQQKEEYSVYFSANIDDIAKNTEELISFGESEFVIVGDDEIINKFINSISDISKIKLGIIPIGKKDDFSAFLEYNSNPVQAIKNILKREISNIDFLIVNNKRVINNVIVGASVEAYEKFRQYKVKNKISEKYAISKYASKFEGIELAISTKNNKVKPENVFELIVANGGKSKGRDVSPLANVKDGLINLSYVLASNKKDNAKHINLFKKGNHIYSADTKQFWVNNVKISNPSNHIKALIDGEIETVEYLNIQIVENGLKVYKNPKT